MDPQYRNQHLEQLIDKRRESVETYEVHMELMALMKQINIYTADIAKVTPIAGWQSEWS